MCGNGAVIGLAVTVVHRRQILPVLLQALAACYVVAVGTPMRGTVVCLIAPTSIRLTATSITGFAWCCSHSLKICEKAQSKSEMLCANRKFSPELGK